MTAAALMLAIASLGPVVLRGSSQPDERNIVNIDLRGIELASPGADPTLLGWEHIKLVTGDDAPRAEPYTRLADDAWRARSRILRGDARFAAPLLERLTRELHNVRSPTALLAFAGLARARADERDLPAAITAWQRAAELHAQGVRLDPDAASAIHFDQSTGYITDLPAFWFARGEAADRDDFLSLINRALADDPAARSAARSQLRETLPASHNTWREAWTRAALGRSYLREKDAEPRTLGLLELLHLPARFANDQPILTSLALSEVLAELNARNDTASAEIITNQIRSGDPPKPAQPHPPQASPNDQLNNYLEAARLTTLLAENLNVELRAAAGASRAPIARTLARVYAELLESTTDPDRTRAIEQRASALLADVPEADSIDLRLTLARSAYTIAELQAEKWRLRINARAEADTARRAFTDLERRFADLATAAEKRIDSLEKQEEQTSGSGADRRLLSSALASTRRTRSMAHFLAGWSAYYIAELDPPAAPDAVNRAERHFGWILNARAGAAPTTDRVPTQLLTYEHVARACLGVALCQSIRGTEEAALRWTRLVETTPGVPASVARQITARKLIILARTRNWPAVAAVVDPRGGGATTSTLSPIDARLLAVLALEARQAGETSATLTPLIVLALEALAGQGELDQIVELASRYFDRAEDLAPGGFLPAYIRGLREYDRATRERNAAGEPDHRPVTNPEIRRAYTNAARFLNDALASKDADQFTTALPGVTLLHAFSRFYSAQSPADLQDAAALFTRAAALHDPRNSSEAPRARLLAIRALDAALRQSRTPEAAAQRQALIDDFLKRHPTHPAAANVLYERALSEGASPREAAADLLTIPDDSPLALPAHHQAARLLYERFLAAPTESRTTAAAEFLAVAEPLLDRSRRAQQPDTDEATALMLTTARRVVDCLIKLPEPDPRRVRRAFDTVESTIARGIAVPAALHAEVEYRSVQIALLENDWPAAEAALARLRDTDTSLADSAERAIYQHAADRFNQETTDSPARVTLARTLFRFGRDVINHLPERDSNPANPAVATLYYNVARAASAIFAETRETDARDAAASYFSSLISAYPTDANFLRAAAAHSQLAGDTDAALAAWRGLLAGLPQGAPEWFDAKCRVIDLLIATDRDAARAALQQHRILYPDLGPEPWRTRLLEQERRLASDQPEPAP